jgi:hypothetical protein
MATTDGSVHHDAAAVAVHKRIAAATEQVELRERIG